MPLNLKRLRHYLPHINQLPVTPLEKSDLLTDNFLMDRSGDLKMYYAPHNEYINPQAKVVIAGISPGWTQMKAAFEQARLCVQEGDTLRQLIRKCKRAARFAGVMRENLIEMLDDCEVNSAFNLSSCRLLFNQSENLLHTTSIIKYPVFVNETNFTGYTPKITKSSMLQRYAYQIFPQEMKELEREFLLIPLGNAVAEVVKELVNQGKIPKQNCLFGFPHPSGANGHRLRQFQQVRAELTYNVRTFTERINQ